MSANPNKPILGIPKNEMLNIDLFIEGPENKVFSHIQETDSVCPNNICEYLITMDGSKVPISFDYQFIHAELPGLWEPGSVNSTNFMIMSFSTVEEANGIGLRMLEKYEICKAEGKCRGKHLLVIINDTPHPSYNNFESTANYLDVTVKYSKYKIINYGSSEFENFEHEISEEKNSVFKNMKQFFDSTLISELKRYSSISSVGEYTMV